MSAVNDDGSLNYIMMPTRIDEYPKSQKIQIEQKVEGSTVLRVASFLPDGFGMSVGSAFTDPANINLANFLGGKSQTAIAGASRLTGISPRISTNSNTFYAGPEPTEISFEMQFSAYYSAYNEVILPVMNLLSMSVGNDIKDPLFLELYNEYVAKETVGAINQRVIDEFGEEEAIDDAAAQVGIIRGPRYCKVSFGTTMVIDRAYVSSVGAKFSNVLDSQGYPISCDCSVTIKVVKNPVRKEVLGYFSNARR